MFGTCAEVEARLISRDISQCDLFFAASHLVRISLAFSRIFESSFDLAMLSNKGLVCGWGAA
jgi:hypothetical protein